MKRFLTLALAVAVLTGCGIFAADHGWRGYVAAVEELANLAETYQAAYQVASPVARERWEKEIDPLFIRAEDALKAWRAALDLGANPEASQELFLRMRALILKALVEVGEG